MEAPREGAIINDMRARTARNTAKKIARRIVGNTNTVRNEGTANLPFRVKPPPGEINCVLQSLKKKKGNLGAISGFSQDSSSP
jgi:hypothetical protein